MIFVYPTDTAYAVGCDARDKNAVEQIFKIKQRDKFKPLPLIASSIFMAEEWCDFSGKALNFAKKYWPGPVTFILPVKKKGLSDLVISQGSIAIRVPDLPQARKLSELIGAPIVSTSANSSGDKNPYSIQDVKKSLGSKINIIDKIIDAGELAKKPPSTIVLIKNNKIKILRHGEVKIK